MSADHDRRHVLIFLPNLDGGGAERVMLDLSRALSSRSIRTSLVVASGRGALADKVPSGVEYYDLKAGAVIRSILPLSRLLWRLRPDAMLSTLTHANVASIIARYLSLQRNTRVVVREAGSTRGARFATLQQRLSRLAARCLYPFADHVIAVSNALAIELEEEIPRLRGRVATIYNPVIDSSFQERSKAVLSHRWLSSTIPVILSAGRLVEVKGFDVLLKAIAIVRARRECRAVILGDGPLRRRLQELAVELKIDDIVDLPGFVPNPLPYMKSCDVFVLASKREGLPNVLIQALACGAKVVSTDCPTGPAEILDGGRLGTLVSPNDPELLAVAIQQALEADPVPPDWEHLQKFTEMRSVEQYSKVLFS